MHVVLERAGKKETVEVAPDVTRVTFAGRTYPVTVVRNAVNKVELEIDGEKAVVENWPEHFGSPFGPVDVNGERWTVKVEVSASDTAAPTAARAGLAPATAAPPAVGPSPAPPGGEGVAVVPAMPGRVIEVRVAEGQRVTKGQTLLILEAMKMRGEVTSPADGVVHDLRVAAGANARAKEPMMWVVPEKRSA